MPSARQWPALAIAGAFGVVAMGEAHAQAPEDPPAESDAGAPPAPIVGEEAPAEAPVAPPEAARPPGPEADPRPKVVAETEASEILAKEEDEEEEGEDDGRGYLKNWVALPLVLYTPETELVGSVLGIYFFPIGDRALNRSSSIRGVGAISTRGQTLVNLEDELWFDENRWRIKNIFQYRNWPDSFFGIGNQTQLGDEEEYTYVRFQIISEIERAVWRNLYVGLVQQAEYIDVTELAAGGILSGMNPDFPGVPGVQGGWASGVGVSLTWDDRDNALYSTKGGLYRLDGLVYQEVFGSRYDFGLIRADARHFFVPWLDHVIAIQAELQYAPGNVPFTMMPSLGGSRNMRGIYNGRFRDKGMATLQLAYRFPLFWRFKWAFFAAAGEVFRDFGDLSFDGIHVAVGGGLRFQISDSQPAHARLDVGWSPDGTFRFYLQILEAF